VHIGSECQTIITFADGFRKIKMKKTFVILALLFFTKIGYVCAQDEQPVARPLIFDTLTNASDSTSGTVVLHQDSRIERLISNKMNSGTPYAEKYTTAQGFRVQVFSSNEVKTAKADAYKIEELIKSKHPELDTYVIYQSPFWKVRVGDCETNLEAQDLRSFLRSEFPEIKDETYIVREQIRIPDPF
jgi:hypothetical protein